MGEYRMPTAFPEFAWSESRDRRLRECRRLYYLSVYATHGGWMPTAASDRRTAWTLGRLIPSWRVALGSAIHDAATQCVHACATGRGLPEFARLRRAAGLALNRIYVSSQRTAAFRRAPGVHPMLADRFYGKAWDRHEIAVVRRDLDHLLLALLSLEDLWERVTRAGRTGVWVPDRWLSFALDVGMPAGYVRVIGAPDLVLRAGPGEPLEIWDWKTGTDDGAVDAVLTYGLAVRHAPSAPPQIRTPGGAMHGRIICLGRRGQPGSSDAAFEIHDDDLSAARERIAASVTRMRDGLRDAARNEPLAEAYPQTTNERRCHRCIYRGICHPDRFPIASGGEVRRRGA